MQINGFNLWLIEGNNTGESLTREKSLYLTLQWCEAEPLCWTLPGLLLCSQEWWLGQRILMMIVNCFGCEAVLPSPSWLSNYSVNSIFIWRNESKSWPGNMCSLWRIRIFKIDCSEGSRVRGHCISLASSGILTFHYCSGPGSRGSCKTMLGLNLGWGRVTNSSESGVGEECAEPHSTVISTQPALACFCHVRIGAHYYQILWFSRSQKSWFLC